jgi:cyclase
MKRSRINLNSVLLCVGLLISTVSGVGAQSVNSKNRSFTKVAEGVFMIIHPDAPDGFPQSNTAVIIGDHEVLAVDACYLPSSAREDILQIKQWTNKPIRYLVNTHWHYDHTMGNGVYAEMCPGLGIIAHVETQRQNRGYNAGWFERFPGRAETFKQIVETGKTATGRVVSEAERKEYAEYYKGVQPVQEEYKKLVDRSPNISFTDEMNIDLGNREVQIKFLGKGNTAGDAVIYLPKEKIMIAGDLVDHPVPYLGGGYPSSLVTTLKKMSTFDIDVIIPGHGTLLKGAEARSYLSLVTDFISTICNEVSKQVHILGNGSRNLEKIQEAVDKNVDVKSWREKFAHGDKDNETFFQTFSYPGVVTAAYAEIWGR